MNAKMLIKCLLAAALIAAVFPSSVNGDPVQVASGAGDSTVLTEARLMDSGDAEGTASTPEPRVLPMLIAGTIALAGWRGVHIWR